MVPRLSAFGLILLAATALAPEAAFAHVGGGSTSGFAHGFFHPIGGIDHVLAMVAVGMFAANLGGRALWAVPATFVAVMAFGGLLGIEHVAIPYVEIGIAVSVIVLGLVVALRVQWPVAAAMALVALLAIFHGHAHGEEMPLSASAATYAAGFVLGTGLLHLAGIALGIAGRTSDFYGRPTAQLSGAAISLAGVGLLAGVL